MDMKEGQHMQRKKKRNKKKQQLNSFHFCKIGKIPGACTPQKWMPDMSPSKNCMENFRNETNMAKIQRLL